MNPIKIKIIPYTWHVIPRQPLPASRRVYPRYKAANTFVSPLIVY